MSEKELISMKLHEFHQEKYFEVFRVLNGWVYTFDEKRFCEGVGDQITKTSVFVPEK